MWLFPGMPLAVCVAALTAIGPAVQQVASSALNTRAPSIYAAAYNDEIANWPFLGDWLLEPYNLVFVLVGVLASTLALRKASVQEVAVATGGWVAFLLTLADAAISLIRGGGTQMRSMAANIVANAIGGAAVGLIVFLALASAQLLARGGGPTGTSTARSICIVATGLVSTTTAYLVLTFLYQPLPVSMEAILRAPANGWFSTDLPRDAPPTQTGAERAVFSPLPPFWPVDDLSVMTPGSPLRLRWVPGTRGPRTLEVRFYTDCLFKGPAQLPAGPATLTLDGRRSYSVNLDSGGFVDGAKLASVEFAPVRKRDLVMFSLAKAKRGRGMELTRFDGPGQDLRAKMRDGSRLSVGTALFEPRSKKRARAARAFTLVGAGRTLRLTFKPTGPIERDTRQRCSLVPPIANGAEGHPPLATVVRGRGLGVVALFTATGDPDALSFSLEDTDPALEMSGVNGWSTASGFGDAAQVSATAGSTRAVTFSGTVSEFQVDGQPVPSRPYDDIVAQGSIDATWISAGSLRLHGTADQLWRNSRRLNPTRWERTPTEWQVSAVGAFAATLLALWRLLWPAAKRVAGNPVG